MDLDQCRLRNEKDLEYMDLVQNDRYMLVHRRQLIWSRRLRDQKRSRPVLAGSVSVVRYFMHLRDGVDETLDPEGMEFAEPRIASGGGLFAARDLMAGDIRNGIVDLHFRIDAEDESGAIVYTLPFRHALNIIPEAA